MAGGIESLRPRQSLLDLGGSVDGDERSNGFGHVEDRAALEGCGIEALIGALRFRLANIVVNCGVVREPCEMGEFRKAFTRVTENPIGTEGRGRWLSECRRNRRQRKENQSWEENCWARVLEQHVSP